MSFRYQLIIAFSLVTTVVLSGAIWLSAKTADDTVISNAQRGLDVAQQVLIQRFVDRQNQLTERAVHMASTLSAKDDLLGTEATSSSDSLMLTPANRVLIAWPNQRYEFASAATIDALTLRSRSQVSTPQFFYRDDKLYQIAVTKLTADLMVASPWLLLAEPVDEDFIEQLSKQTLAEITLFYSPSSNATQFVTSLDMLDGFLSSSEDQATATARVMDHLGQGDMLNRHFSVGEPDTGAIGVVLTSPMAAALAEWRPWQQGLWIIGIISLLFTGVTSWVLAQRVTQPIEQLVTMAKAISSGDYSNNLQLHSSNEFNFLALSMNNMGNAVKDREQQILNQAQHDGLTGLPNRTHLYTLITTEEATTGAYLVLQLNGFQALTDTYGLDWADTFLQHCAALFNSALAESDLLARIARDQFVVYCPHADKTRAKQSIEHILNTLAEPIICQGIDINLELRIGAALQPEHGSDPEDLLRRASVALSNASTGLQGMCFYEHQQDAKLSRQQRVTQRLQQAIVTNGLSLCFQPKLDLHRNRVTQVEALLRWDDKELGRVSPEEFIPLAERSGDIYALSDWVMKEAARIVSQWQQQSMPIIMGINISGRDFKRENFVDKTLHIIKAQGAKPEQFLLEITESATMDSIDQAITHLGALAQAGFRLAIDDFGTGFSSLSQLKRLPVDELKIDKSFIVELDANPSDYKIVRATINLGHNLGMTVVAEGVENHTSLQLLRQMGCDLIQGYHLTHPLNNSDFIQWWREHDHHIAQAIDPNAQQSLLTT